MYISVITCPLLNAPRHGSINNCGNKMADTCVFVCDDGYVFDAGSSWRTCLECGHWDGTPPRCKGRFMDWWGQAEDL